MMIDVIMMVIYYVVLYMLFAVASTATFPEKEITTKYEVITRFLSAVFWPIYLLYLFSKVIMSVLDKIKEKFAWFMSLPDIEPDDETNMRNKNELLF